MGMKKGIKVCYVHVLTPHRNVRSMRYKIVLIKNKGSASDRGHVEKDQRLPRNRGNKGKMLPWEMDKAE